MVENQSNRRKPFVAQRDDVPTHRAAPSRGNRSQSRTSKKRAGERPPGSRQLVSLLIGVSILSLIAGLATLARFSWQQSQDQAELQRRFDSLTQRLESTDQSLSQSGAALVLQLQKQEETLDTHWSEIKKLWGVSNDRNKKAIADLKTTSSGYKAELDKTLKRLAANDAQLKALRGDVAELNASILAGKAHNDEVLQQLDALNNKLAKTDGALAKLGGQFSSHSANVSRRLKEQDQAIKSIDAFRKQTNEQFNRLRGGVVPAP